MRKAGDLAPATVAMCALITMPVLSGCLDHPLKPVQYDKSQEKQNTIALEANKDVDILFVIDNSGSMGDEQATLAANFGAFIDVLEREGVDANYRIGVTTTDNGNPACANTSPEGGKLRLSSCRSRLSEFTFDGTNKEAEACLDICDHDDIDIQPSFGGTDDAVLPRPWLERVEGTTNLPDGISTVDAFQCFGPQGINGCGFESHLESMYKALSLAQKDGAESFGFLRSHALLAVIFVTDEADCSWSSTHKQIFQAEDNGGTEVFWNNPGGNQPTSAVCWNAGVECSGDGSPYDECHPTNYDLSRNPDAADEDAVLNPVDRYVGLLQNIEDAKRELNPNQEVLVGVIAGVPEGYSRNEADIEYRDPFDSDIQQQFGVGAGCQREVDGVLAGDAYPPVRMIEFAEAFEVEDQRNVFSVCAPDYTGALDAIAETIADQLRPACMPACVADSNPATEAIEPNCTLAEEFAAGSTRESRDVPECAITTDGWDFPSADEHVCYRELTTVETMSEECIADGWNLEFVIERRVGYPAKPGTSVKATCQLSENRDRDCPQP